jgi:hypothetical protein
MDFMGSLMGNGGGHNAEMMAMQASQNKSNGDSWRKSDRGQAAAAAQAGSA